MTRGKFGVGIAVCALALAGAAMFVPLWAPLVLATWTADLVRPLQRWLERVLRGRRAGAGALTVMAVLAIAAPTAATVFLLVGHLRELLALALRSGSVRAAVRDVLGTGPSVEPSVPGPRAWLQLVREHGADVWAMVSNVWAASVSLVVGVVVFAVALYALAVDGRRLYGWLARRLPFCGAHRRRLVSAFRETGRGLIVGTGGTALAQGILATGTYVALDVHNPFALGLLTGVVSIAPAVGTALVWAPVAVALALVGHPIRAAILVGIGLGIIGTVDNFLRPWLSRLGHLRLPTSVVLLSMLGGLDLTGAWGIILGPLLVRMAVEALTLGPVWPSRSSPRTE